MDIRKFVSEAFGEVDVFTDEDNEIWFSGNQIAEALGYEAPRNAIAKFVDAEDRKALKIKACTESVQAILWTKKNDFSNKTIINEYGMYSLVMRSYAPKAKEFQHWVTHEVLPSIRKNGGYISGQEELKETDPSEYEKLTQLIKLLSEKIRTQNEKVAFLQKRRHELLAEGRKNLAALRKLKAEEKELNDLAAMYERQIQSLQKDLENYYPRRSSGYRPAATEVTVVTADGFVQSRKVIR